MDEWMDRTGGFFQTESINFQDNQEGCVITRDV